MVWIQSTNQQTNRRYWRRRSLMRILCQLCWSLTERSQSSKFTTKKRKSLRIYKKVIVGDNGWGQGWVTKTKNSSVN